MMSTGEAGSSLARVSVVDLYREIARRSVAMVLVRKMDNGHVDGFRSGNPEEQRKLATMANVAVGMINEEPK